MRIVSGKYKGKRFDVPHSFKARPTTDFAKEGLFNILVNNYVDFDSSPRALDLFCGTGSISLELASRGCREVIGVEKDFRHWQFLSQTSKVLGDRAWKPLHADVFKFITRSQEPYDIIFADPPYMLPNIEEIPDLVLGNNLLAKDGIFILEHGKSNTFTSHPRFVSHRNYGSVNFTFFQ